jgi:hypothetical protein
MSATRNLQSSVLFALPFIGYQPANISNNEPAITAANLTKQTILGAPFKWAWNRDTFSIEVDGTSQDYVLELAQFGFLEQAWLTDTKGKVKEIAVKKSLAAESTIARPQSVSVVQQDDTESTITVRLNTIPEQAYTLTCFFQKAPILMSSLAASWAPIPDHLGYIYDWGFLGMLSLITKDARMPIFMQKFAAHQLGAQDGLTALQRNIFLGNWLDVVTAQEREQLVTQQGVTSRQT